MPSKRCARAGAPPQLLLRRASQLGDGRNRSASRRLIVAGSRALAVSDCLGSTSRLRCHDELPADLL